MTEKGCEFLILGALSNQRYLSSFLKELTAFGFTEKRIKRYRYVVEKQLNAVGKVCTETSKDDVMSWLVELQSSKLSEETKYTYKSMLRKFYRWLQKPEVVDWIPMNYPRKQRDPAEILTKEEIERIAAGTSMFRDRVYVKVLWESGCRWGELKSLQVKHVTFDENGAILSINGKTGRRLVRIMESSALLRELLTDKEAEDYVFPMKHGAVYQMLLRAAKRSGIKKRCNPHSFRFSRATYLANKGLNLWQMMKHFGWKNPDTAQVYIRMSTSDLDQAILNLYKEVRRDELRKSVQR